MTESSLNRAIAVAVAVAATCVAVFNIKANNIVQAMAQAQARSVDTWAFFQAKSIKQSLAENTQRRLELLGGKNPAALRALEALESTSQRYEAEKNQIKAKAEAYEAEYERLNFRDDQFDIAEALLSLGMAVFGLAALLNQRRLFYFGIGMGVVGLLFGIAGFVGWSIRPEWLARLLG